MRTSLASEWIIPIEELKIKEVIGIGHFGRVHRFINVFIIIAFLIIAMICDKDLLILLF